MTSGSFWLCPEHLTKRNQTHADVSSSPSHDILTSFQRCNGGDQFGGQEGKLFDPLLDHYEPLTQSASSGSIVVAARPHLGWVGAKGVQVDLQLNLKSSDETRVVYFALECDEGKLHSISSGGNLPDGQSDPKYQKARVYDMPIQFEKMLAVAKCRPQGLVYIRVNGDDDALNFNDDGMDIRRGVLVWIMDQYLEGHRTLSPNQSDWWIIDGPPQRTYNGAQFISLDVSKVFLTHCSH